MRKKKSLKDEYQFPGFYPKSEVEGVFGDPKARVITLVRRQKKTSCGTCGSVSRSFYDRKKRRVRDLPCGDSRVYLEFEIRRVDCKKCGKVKQEKLPWLADNSFYTKRFAFFYRQALSLDDDTGSSPRDAPKLAYDQGT